MEAVVCHSVLHRIPLCPHFYVQTFTSVSRHWSGLRLLASAILLILDPQWDSSQLSSCCSVSQDPAALDLQDQPLDILKQFIDGVGVGGGSTQSPGSRPGW